MLLMEIYLYIVSGFIEHILVASYFLSAHSLKLRFTMSIRKDKHCKRQKQIDCCI